MPVSLLLTQQALIILMDSLVKRSRVPKVLAA